MSESKRTIIQFRRDSDENWMLNKDVIPHDGEPCYNRDAGVVVYGNGVDTYETLWAKYQAGVVKPVQHFDGVKKDGETDQDVIARVLADKATDDVPVEIHKGDSFVVRSLIAADMYSYTAYVYDGENWVAMDGNYDANSVIFAQDLTITAPTGIYTQEMIDEANGSITHAAEGKSLMETLMSLFAETKEPEIVEPVVSMTVSSSPARAEVGTKITSVTWNGSFTAGSYEYGSMEGDIRHTDTGTGIAGVAWEINNSVDEQTSTAEDGTFTFAGDNQIVIDSTTSKTYATITWAGTYGDSPRTPVNNLGVKTEGQIVGAKKTGSASVTATGYRNSFYYVGTDCETAVDSTFVRAGVARNANTKDFNVNTYSKDGKTKCLTIPAGTKRILLAVPGTATLSEVKDLDGMGLDVKGNFTTATKQVNGANGFAAADYTIFECVNPDGIAATSYVITIK